MIESERTAVRAVRALGKGFDLTCDFRLPYAKGGDDDGGILVELDGKNVTDVVTPGGIRIPDVPAGVRCDKGERIRFRSDVLEFNQMSTLLNHKSSIQVKIPSGYFNMIFNLSGAWLDDATATKHLAFDGYFISLYNLHLTESPLVLREEVKKAVPSSWDPAALARFIQKYGTHILVGMSVGGQDLICVRQSPSSPIPPAELKKHLENLGDYYFSDGSNRSPLRSTIKGTTQKVPEVFSNILHSNNMQLASFSATSSKDGITIICSKRGGNVSADSHYKWLQSVHENPAAILFKFVPITTLLTGIPGCGYLSHGINLYLRYKPAPEDLRYFLEFQVPLQWAPVYNELPLGLTLHRKKTSSPFLQFRFMGPKLQVSTTEVTSSGKPVVGLRLYLEGRKFSRLAIHVQHLSNHPRFLSTTIQEDPRWRGSDEAENQYFEPVRWKKFSHVCTAPVKFDPEWLNASPSGRGAYIVTGTKLQVKSNQGRRVLHLHLCYSHIPNCTIHRKIWCRSPETTRKSGILSTLSTTFSITGIKDQAQAATPGPPFLNSGVFPEGPPVQVQSKQLLRFVDTAEVTRGPHDPPGYWLVTGARLVLNDSEKISLQVKFALLQLGYGS